MAVVKATKPLPQVDEFPLKDLSMSETDLKRWFTNMQKSANDGVGIQGIAKQSQIYYNFFDIEDLKRTLLSTELIEKNNIIPEIVSIVCSYCEYLNWSANSPNVFNSPVQPIMVQSNDASVSYMCLLHFQPNRSDFVVCKFVQICVCSNLCTFPDPLCSSRFQVNWCRYIAVIAFRPLGCLTSIKWHQLKVASFLIFF